MKTWKAWLGVVAEAYVGHTEFWERWKMYVVGLGFTEFLRNWGIHFWEKNKNVCGDGK